MTTRLCAVSSRGQRRSRFPSEPRSTLGTPPQRVRLGQIGESPKQIRTDY